MTRQRPAWPVEHYRVLRSEENFGCGKCGTPIMTIHHIEGYEEGKLAPTNELIMLCKEHHNQADEGQISKEELYSLKAHPFNEGIVRHRFQVSSSKELTMHIGGSVFIETPVALQLMGEPIISVRREGDAVLYSAKLYGKDGALRMQMTDNVWEADTNLADVWYREGEDFEAWLKIKLEDSEPYSEVKVADGELYIGGRFFLRGNLLDVSEDGSFMLNRSMFVKGMNAYKCGVGINIG
jgi:hypothetical protein